MGNRGTARGDRWEKKEAQGPSEAAKIGKMGKWFRDGKEVACFEKSRISGRGV
jgi:hypothetical protein